MIDLARLHLIISVIGILLTIFFVVGIHEGAHFLVARLLNVKVLRFSIGFGKSLFRWHDKKGTEYVIALIPLGGYVKMLDEREEKVPKNELALAYNRQPFYKKALIVLAGPVINILSALVLYWIIFMIGFVNIKPVVGSVVSQSIAAQSGIRPNQEIIRVDDKITSNWTSVLFRLIMHAGDQDQLKIETRDLQDKTIRLHHLDLTDWHLDELSPNPLASLGIKPLEPGRGMKWSPTLLNYIQYGPFAAIAPAWQQVVDLTYLNFLLIKKMIVGKLSVRSLGGPITIFESAGMALNAGWVSFLSFLAFLSITIGLINFLPIPGLDGGHLVIQGVEFLIRRPLPDQMMVFLYHLGFLLIFFLILQALINDIFRL